MNFYDGHIGTLAIVADVSARLGSGGSARDRRRQRRLHKQHLATLRTFRAHLGARWGVAT